MKSELDSPNSQSRKLSTRQGSTSRKRTLEENLLANYKTVA